MSFFGPINESLSIPMNEGIRGGTFPAINFWGGVWKPLNENIFRDVLTTGRYESGICGSLKRADFGHIWQTIKRGVTKRRRRQPAMIEYQMFE